jgi:integrase/recombinase XerD
MTPLPALTSALAFAIADYVSLKRALGRRFGNEAYVLAAFDRYLATSYPTASTLTAQAFAAWCLTIAHLSPTTRRARMRIVHNLCLYIRRSDPGAFVPDPATFPMPDQPQRPYIFSRQDIARLLSAADNLPARSGSPLRSQSYRLVIVLLYTVGLRRGEVVRLRLSDYDPNEQTLLIRASKFHRSRLVALSTDAASEMETFLTARRQLPHNQGSPLLVSSWRGLRARSGPGLGNGLRHLFRTAGVRTESGEVPRVHDLRHTHAVHALLRWYRAGADVQAKLPALATSMGHVSIVSTAYYLTQLEPVTRAAGELFADHVAAIIAPEWASGGAR